MCVFFSGRGGPASVMIGTNICSRFNACQWKDFFSRDRREKDGLTGWEKLIFVYWMGVQVGSS